MSIGSTLEIQGHLTGQNTMAKVIFTPWKEHSQLLAVRDQFYPPLTYDGPDLRSKACATVCPRNIYQRVTYISTICPNPGRQISVWKIRGNLPHAVEATALLTDAILHDDAQKNSVFSIRATYSAAFCRYVPPGVGWFLRTLCTNDVGS